jgi:hypothetical protein
MVNKIVFDRQGKLTWHTRNLWHRKDQAEDYINALKKKYRFKKCFTANSHILSLHAEDSYTILVVIVFENEADEAEFMMRESL